MSGTHRSRLGWLCLVSILTAPVQAQLPDLNIAVDSVRLTWPVTVEECIVVCSESIDGPWRPVPVPILHANGQYQAVVRCSDQQKYFRLAKGTWFMDDFEDGLAEGYSIHYPSLEAQEAVSLDERCGHLHITSTPVESVWGLRLLRSDLSSGDFALSIDVLDCDPDSMTRMLVNLFARVDLGLPPDEDNPADGCVAGWTPFYDSPVPGESVLWAKRAGSSPRDLFHGTFDQPDLQNTYRLVFSGVGERITLELFNRDTGELMARQTAEDAPPLPSGKVGWGIAAGKVGGMGTIDVTLDNFIAVVIAPD